MLTEGANEGAVDGTTEGLSVFWRSSRTGRVGVLLEEVGVAGAVESLATTDGAWLGG